MNIEERIKLRDELIDALKKSSIISLTSRGWYRINNREDFNTIINNNNIKDKYKSYINEFRTEEEGIYNLLHIIDYSENLCPFCNKEIRIFYDNKHGYRNTCGGKECNYKAHNNYKERAENTYIVKKKNIDKKKDKSVVNNANIVKRITIKHNDNTLNDNNINNIIDDPKNVMDYTIVKNEISKYNINLYNSNQNYKTENVIVNEKDNLIKIIRKSISESIEDELWNNDDKIKEYIINEYNKKDGLLELNKVYNPFKVSIHTVKAKLEELDLLKYFYKEDNYILDNTFKKFLEDNNINDYAYNDRILNFDFFLYKYKIGININDINTHNCIKNKDKFYHLNETITADSKDIRLIHIWEWELRNSNEWNKLSKWFLNQINSDINYIKKDYEIKIVPLQEEKNFLNSYHLQGYIKSNLCLGIYYNNTIIQMISFGKPRYNKNYQYELLRLCTRYGYSVLEGFNKLLSYFIKNYNPSSIISYCNLDKFTGKVYEDIGFKLDKIGEPQVTWCNRNMKHFYQSSLNMIGADKLLGVNYGKGTDNESIVLAYGFLPIYNCGLAVYTWKK